VYCETLVTDAIRIDDWQCRYLMTGCEGPGWYTYVLGRPVLKIDNLPVASRWLPMLESARLCVKREG
jgi:hypothetical protein